jgi:hypothetical protein
MITRRAFLGTPFLITLVTNTSTVKEFKVSGDTINVNEKPGYIFIQLRGEPINPSALQWVPLSDVVRIQVTGGYIRLIIRDSTSSSGSSMVETTYTNLESFLNMLRSAGVFIDLGQQGQ